MWRIRKDYAVPGIVFAYYLILSGVERFFIELIRLNPIVVAGMTQAQIISLIMMITGILLLISRKRLEKQAEAVMV